jgi:hypothetical protein
VGAHSLKEVEDALASLDPATGALVTDQHGETLAHRPPLPGGGFVLIPLGVELAGVPKGEPNWRGGLMKPR